MKNIIYQTILERANVAANLNVLYNIYVGTPAETGTVTNIEQAISLIKTNNSNLSTEQIKKDISSAKAIALAVEKQNKSTVGIAMIRKPDENRKLQIFKDADNEELASEYIFELDNIFIHKNFRGKGLGEYLINRLLGIRSGRGSTIYCQTNSEDVSRVLKTYFRFDNLKETNEPPYLLGLM